MTSLPLIGRAEELDVVRGSLARGGCLIAGTAGVGKSALASAAVEGAGAVERIVATSASETIPFGVVTHLLGPDPAAAPIPAVIATLRERHGTDLPTLLVDDAHLLDSGSAALVLTVATTRAARIVATVRTPEPVPDPIVSLWKDGWVDRIDLVALGRDDIRRLVGRLLDGRVHAHVHSRIYELSQGNPLYVRELVHDATRTGALAPSERGWSWTEQPVVADRLRDLVTSYTRTVSDDARRALELLAIGAPLRLEDVETLTSPDAVEELEREGLLTLTDSRGRTEVELTHPLYGEVTATGLPRSTTRRLGRELADVLSARTPLDDADILRVASWRLAAGDVDEATFVAAGAAALRRGDPHLAQRFLEHTGTGIDAALVAAGVRNALARFEDVEAILAPFEDAAARTTELAATYIEVRSQALLRGDRPAADSTALLDRCEEWTDSPAWQALVANERGWVAIYEGRPADACEAVAPHLDDDRVGWGRRMRLLAIGMFATTRLGRFDEGDALDARVQQLSSITAERRRLAGFAPYAADTFARTESGRDLVGATARVREGRVDALDAGDLPLAGELGFSEGVIALVRGHLTDALRNLGEAADALTLGDPFNEAAWIYTALAKAHALANDAPSAAAALASARTVLDGRPNLHRRLRLEIGRAAAWLDVASGRTAAACRRLLDLADEAGADVVGASNVIYDALRFGAPASLCAQRLARLEAGWSDGDLPGLRSIHAATLADRDPKAALQVAARFADLGVDLFAAEAAATAAEHFGGEGRSSSQRRAAALAASYRARCQGAWSPLLSAAPQTSDLTPREREIASLAARDMTNADIADRLTLSVRTVETYVLRACRKLGVSSRHDLAGALGSPREVS